MKVGVLGTAHPHADGYVGRLRSVAGVAVAGVADHDHARAAAWGRAHDVAVFGSYEALLDAGIDAAVVCAETVRHRRLVEAAAGRGVHVLCEKPLATTVDDATAIVDACDAAGVILMPAFPMRFNAPVSAVRDLIRDGTLGRVHALSGENTARLPRDRAWLFDPALAGGGAVMDHTVHVADVLRWYLEREVVEVYAVTNRLLHADTVAVETGGLLMLTFDDGAFATIDCSWSRPDGYPTWGGLRLEVVGEHGVAAVDAFAQHLEVFPEATGPVRRPAWGSDAEQAMIAAFCAAARDGRDAPVTGIDGLRATEVALAAYDSVRSGGPVRPAARA